MNALDIESELAKNLGIINKALQENNPGKFETAIKNFNRSMIGKVKSIKPGLTIEKSNTDKAMIREAISETQRKLNGEGTTVVAKKKLEKQLQSLNKQLDKALNLSN
jgi:hypothetical protein